jgi:2-oxoglutarate ferredoxin oxidoreductase subunit beta
MASVIQKAIAYPGFSVVDIMTACPTYFGRMNEISEPYDMVRYLRDTTAPMDECDDGEAEPPEHPPMPIGVFRDEIRPDYGTLYKMKIAASKEKGLRK